MAQKRFKSYALINPVSKNLTLAEVKLVCTKDPMVNLEGLVLLLRADSLENRPELGGDPLPRVIMAPCLSWPWPHISPLFVYC